MKQNIFTCNCLLYKEMKYEQDGYKAPEESSLKHILKGQVRK
jgi:hypothetical protein